VHDALALCDQAIESLERSGDGEIAAARRADLHARKASLYVLQSDFACAHAENERVAIIARKLSDTVREGAAVAEMALASVYGHEFDRALDEASDAIKIGSSAGSAEIVAAGRWSTGWVQAVTGHLQEAGDNLEHAYELSISSGNAFYHASTASDCALLYAWQAEWSPAVAKANEGVQLARTHNLAFPLLIGLFQLVDCL
jgi:hypothetical protein